MDLKKASYPEILKIIHAHGGWTALGMYLGKHPDWVRKTLVRHVGTPRRIQSREVRNILEGTQRYIETCISKGHATTNGDEHDHDKQECAHVMTSVSGESCVHLTGGLPRCSHNVIG